MGFGLGTTSGAGAGALGLALSAVDKVAGKKTTEQLANLAQCESRPSAVFLFDIAFQIIVC